MAGYMEHVEAFTETDRHTESELPGKQLGAVSAVSAVSPLPSMHDTDDPWMKPTAPCMVCGQAQWRVWCHDEHKVWQWICNGCRPLVVRNRDGTIWRSDAP